MSNQKSYPHYEINVKDNSIYNFAVEEVLPVHRPVWVLPTQEGPVGQPVWCANASKMMKIFGEQTLNEANKRYFTTISYYLKQLFTLNGGFIVRALPKEATYASSVLEAWIRNTQIPVHHKQGDTDINPGSLAKVYDTAITLVENFDKTGANIADEFEYGVSQYGKYAINHTVEMSERGFDVDGNLLFVGTRQEDGSVKYIFQETGETWIRKFNEDGSVKEWTQVGVVPPTTGLRPAENPSLRDVKAAILVEKEAELASAVRKFYYTVTPETIDGIQLVFVARPAREDELEAIADGTYKGTIDTTDVNWTKYPLLAVRANYPGEYGNDLAFSFFNRLSENDNATVAFYRSVFNSLSVYRREYNTTTVNSISDIYGRVYNTFSADPDCYDKETAIKYGMEPVIESAFDAEDSDSPDFPFVIYSCEENLKAIGNRIWALESAESLGILDMGWDSKESAEAELGDKVGYLVNVLGCKNNNDIPYESVINGFGGESANVYTFVTDDDIYEQVADYKYLVAAKESDEADYESIFDICPEAEIVKASKDHQIFLTMGSDGVTDVDAHPHFTTNFIDQSMYQFVKLHINDTIVDKFRYPFTHLYDVGYSMTTKYAMIDFLDIRDDVGVELTTQVLFDNEWATHISRPIKINDQAADIANGIVLRERALLMRESVLKGTDCIRCSIYSQTGNVVSQTYTDPIPFVFWSAYQHAQYGNLPYMSAPEPRGLPYSYNDLFKEWNWTPHSELQKEKTWNAGINYCQYADMTRIFYPSLRTVYRAETSSLIDQWVVDAIIYTKHECRKAWAKFVGRNDKVSVLQDGIKTYLENKLAYLYNGKYDFTVEVYQTEEEKKIGYIQHVRLSLVFPATMRVLVFDIEVNREGYNSVEA